MSKTTKPEYDAVYLTSAERDINDAVRYIAVDLSNLTAAENLLAEIDEKVNSLRHGYWRGQSLQHHSSGIFTDIEMNWCAIKGY